MKVDRLQAFSDGVFSIAATLLVLQLRVPTPHPRQTLIAAILGEWPQLIAYIGAFLAIGSSWLGHRSIVMALTRDNHEVHVANLMVLVTVAFIPFPALLVADFHSGARLSEAAALLSANLAVVGAALNLLYAAGRPTGFGRSTRPLSLRSRLTPGLIGPLLYACATGVSLLSGTAGLLLDLSVSIAFLLLPARKAKRG